MSNIDTDKFSARGIDFMTEFSGIEEIPGMNSRAVLKVEDSVHVFKEDEDIQPVKLGDRVTYIPWGGDNMLPYNILDLIEKDETMTTGLNFVSELCYGAGLVYNTDNCSDDVCSEVEDFSLDNLLQTCWFGCCQDLRHFGFAVTVLILNNIGSKIVGVHRKEAMYCRFSPSDESNGCIRYVHYGNWRKSLVGEDDVETIELLNIHHPWRDLAVRMGLRPGDDGESRVRTKCRKFAVLSKIPTVDSCYYPIPSYASLFKSKWYDIKQLIAVGKKSKLKNSAPIKYHVEVSQKHFENIFRDEHITDPLKKLQRVKKEKQSLLEFLTGIENSGKAWFSTYYTTPDGKESHEIKITRIDTGKEGGDWESDIQEAVNIMCFVLRVHPNLVGAVPGKAQTNNSGSDKRELYTIGQAIQKPYRDILFPPHKIIIKYNDWKGVYPDCPFIQLTTLDEKKDAKQVTTIDPE